MPFYYRLGTDTLEQASVTGPDFTLDEATHAEHVYPVKGWHWFATAQEARVAMLTAEETNQIRANVIEQTQRRLDGFAQTRNYDSILSAATYATSAVPKFAAEGQYAVAVRDATWAALYALLADVQAGTAPMPTDFVDVEPKLPNLEWPA